MTRGLSKEQLALVLVYAAALAVTFIAVLMQQWVFAAASAVVAFGLFSALVVLTLGAMTHAASGARRLLHDLGRSIKVGRTVALFRRLEERSSQMSKTLEATEARLRASEARMLAAFETHRQHMDDEFARIRSEGQGGRPTE